MSVKPEQFLAKGVKVFLFLDFDGVLNHFPQFISPEDKSALADDLYTEVARGEGVVHYDGYDGAVKRSWPITWAPEAIQELNDILADKRIQLLWLTSWEENIIPVQEDLLKLKPANSSRVLQLQRRFSDTNNRHAKLEAWEIFSEELPPASVHYVWIDDEVVEHHEERLEWEPALAYDEVNEYAEAFRRYDKTLRIQPNSIIGFQPSHLQIVRNFLKTVLEEEEL